MGKFFKKALSTLALFGSAFGAKSIAKEIEKTEIETAIEKTIGNSSLNENVNNQLEMSERDNEKNKESEKQNRQFIMENPNDETEKKSLKNDKLVQDEKIQDEKSTLSSVNDIYKEKNENKLLPPKKNDEIDPSTKKNLVSPKKDYLNQEFSENEINEFITKMETMKNKFLDDLLKKAKKIMLDGKEITHLNGMKTLEVKLLCENPENPNQNEERFFEFDLGNPIALTYTGICRLIKEAQILPHLQNTKVLTPEMRFSLDMYTNFINERTMYEYIKQHLDELPNNPSEDNPTPQDDKTYKMTKQTDNSKDDKTNQKNSESKLTKLGHTIKKGYKKVKSKIFPDHKK